MNLALFHAINGLPEAWSPFLRLFSEAANQGWFKVAMGILVIAMIAAGKNSRRTVIQALIAMGLANPLTDLFKHAVPEHRPFQELASADFVLRAGASPSYGTASAHAANMAAVATVFVIGVRWWGAPWVVVALLTGISRVYVGVHYPYQVVLGWCCGVVAGLLVTKTWETIVKTRNNVHMSEAAQSDAGIPTESNA